MNIETFISDAVRRSVEALYGELGDEQLQIQKTRREFEGDYTLVTFPLLRRSRKSPEATATEIGEYMAANVPEIASFNVIKGFLNLSLDSAFWAARFAEVAADERFGQAPATGRTVMVEYSSPNTNKPLHLGHIRNNLLGYSVAQILKANGHTVIKANLVNDRGIHICKSMLAWKLYGNGETPASSGMKGDHLVGKYYVEFDKHYKAQIRELVAQGQPEDEAKKNAPIMLQAQEMLRKWEARDPEVYSLWETMNGWVYEGFDVTYKALGVDFDKVYYESQTYLLGKSLVEEGLKKGVFYRRPDNSVWIDLTADGLDEKLLLRGDGTSVYMTQDLGTAFRRFEDNRLDDMIYVVGNEQNYHFQVLKLVLKKLGYADWSDHITHLSYGMVELPEGKMKSREGTVVDADDLIEGMVSTAREMSAELGKLDGCSEEEANAVSTMVGCAQVLYIKGRSQENDAVRSPRVDRLQRQYGSFHPVHPCAHPLGASQGRRGGHRLRRSRHGGLPARGDRPGEVADGVSVGGEVRGRELRAVGRRGLCLRAGQAVQWLLPRPFDPQGGERRGAHDASPAGAAGRPRHQGGHETAGYRRPRTHVTHSVIMKNGGFSETSVFSCR